MLGMVKRLIGRPIARRARGLANSFLEQTRHAPEVQRALLLDRIRRHADSQFGRDHHFDEIRTTEDFRHRVPIRGYEGHEPYVDRVRRGDVGALFGSGTEVLMFAMTSGTTNRPKTIPVTRESLNDYREGWTVWGILAFDQHFDRMRQGIRPILQLASDWRETTTESGTPCGAITGLTAHMQNRFVRLNYCMPVAGSKIKDVESKYYVALRHSVHRDLGATIAANPSTLIAIARLGDREKETLIRDLADGTVDRKWELSPEVRSALPRRSKWKRRDAARRLDEIANRTGRLLPRDYWPNLRFMANWMGGTMGAYLRGYPELFGDRPVRDVGLIASEGRMTIPIEDGTPAGILDVRHHYFEFIPEDQADQEQPETVEAADLVEGRNYFILLTTAGGLYRYQIHDLVRCVGFHGRAPLIEFLNKGAHFSSLTGEKLSEFQVVAAVNEAQLTAGLRLGSYLLLPCWGDPPHYALLVEEGDLPNPSDVARLGLEVDRGLSRQNAEYENRRSTLRLGAVQVRRITPGSWGRLQRQRLAKSGGTLEQYKQPHLIPDLAAIDSFEFSDAGSPVSPTG
ncbi:MAG: GH3 auxin-responsive promoter family protein [Isosphaeraceae bacterium]